ncbi:MAG TPA: LLM class flavin-dependent oxidoreductase [Actinomycetota bacterium]|nr:LLM class flavin-dependent oxidoreductase [Actinomycetota bacterium]
MSDYGRDVEFGFSFPPNAADYDQIVRLTRLADEASLDLIGIQDHPYQRRFLDTFALIADLTARTSRVRFFPDVANLPLRHPAVIAKTAASIDVMSGGRFELGLGAGAFWDAIEGMGGPRRTPPEAVESLADAIAVIRLLWGGERNLRYAGRYYRLQGIHSGPVPVHDMGIWIGAGGPRMLELIGRHADGWVPSSGWMTPELLPAAQARIDDAAEAAGRRPADIKRLYNTGGRISDDGPTGYLNGPTGYWVEELTRLVTQFGIDTFIFWPTQDPETQLRVFANEVVPGVRAAVIAQRAGR